MDRNDLFDTDTGIYTNPTESGRLWERPASVELIYPNGREGFQIDAGIRVAGGFSRTASAKKSFRLEFRSDYGPTKLRFPILGNEAVDEFDSLVLRAGFNDAWVWTASRHIIFAISGRVPHSDSWVTPVLMGPACTCISTVAIGDSTILSKDLMRLFRQRMSAATRRNGMR